jgi:predicted membrane-bound spermidine synthase
LEPIDIAFVEGVNLMNNGRRLPGGVALLIYSLIAMGVGFFVYKLIYDWIFHSAIAVIILFLPLTITLSKAAIYLFNTIFNFKSF